MVLFMLIFEICEKSIWKYLVGFGNLELWRQRGPDIYI